MRARAPLPQPLRTPSRTVSARAARRPPCATDRARSVSLSSLTGSGRHVVLASVAGARLPAHRAARAGSGAGMDRAAAGLSARRDRQSSQRRAGHPHRTGRARHGGRMVPQLRPCARRGQLSLSARGRSRVQRLLPVARRSRAQGRADGCEPGARDLRGHRAAQARPRAHRAGRPRPATGACVPDRPGRDPQDHAPLHAAARSRGRRLALSVRRGQRTRHRAVAEPARPGRFRGTIRRAVFPDAPRECDPRRRPPRDHARRHERPRRPRAVPAAGARSGGHVVRRQPTRRRRRVLHAAAGAGSPPRSRDGAPRPGRGTRRVRLHVRRQARPGEGRAGAAARHGPRGRPIPRDRVLERGGAIRDRVDRGLQ